ncbi:MFS transporter [Streptomyces sp. NPDC127039]|uniref:MFS transporter n=1 Tax=Streptomyces sp. NPDC127039 TaxID=3347115 RepID=UPI003668AC1F
MRSSDGAAVDHAEGIARLIAVNLVVWTGSGARFALGSWLALRLTEDASAPVWLLIAELAPTLALAPFFGRLVDHRDRRRLAVTADSIRALTVGVVAVTAATASLHIATLVGMSAVMGACDQISTPARSALLQQRVAREALLKANTRVGISTQVGTMTGVAAGGTAAGILPPSVAFALIAGCHAVAAVLLIGQAGSRAVAATTKPKPVAVPVKEADGPGTWLALRYLRAAGGVRSPFLVVVVLAAFLRTYNSVLPAFVYDTMDFGPAQFGALDAAFAVGGLVGGAALARARVASFLQKRAVLGLFALALCTTAFAFSPGFVAALAAYCGIGITFQTLTLYMTRSQTLVPLERYGRVFSGFTLIGTVLVLALYGLVSALLRLAGPVPVYLLLAAALALLATGQATARPPRDSLQSSGRAPKDIEV